LFYRFARQGWLESMIQSYACDIALSKFNLGYISKFLEFYRLRLVP